VLRDRGKDAAADVPCEHDLIARVEAAWEYDLVDVALRHMRVDERDRDAPQVVS
jgi:hypothetical protein